MSRTLRAEILVIVVAAVVVAIGSWQWLGGPHALRTPGEAARAALVCGGALLLLWLLVDRFVRARVEGPVHTLTHGLEERVGRTADELATRARELDALTERLHAMQLEAVRSERFAALGQTMGTLAHELGTPLNSVLGYTQLLRQQEMDPERSAKLDVIESQVRRMIETIDRTLSRTREGVLEVEDVDVRRIVDEVLTLVSARAAKQHIDIAPEIAKELNDVRADPVALRQVLVNLVNNALDAEETRRIVIRIATPPSPVPTGNLEIEVSDDGAGIPHDEQPRIFEAFYTTKEPGRGTGLGLAIVDHLVRAHGGDISVESIPSRGTTFRVRLPCGFAS